MTFRDEMHSFSVREEPAVVEVMVMLHCNGTILQTDPDEHSYTAFGEGDQCMSFLNTNTCFLFIRGCSYFGRALLHLFTRLLVTVLWWRSIIHSFVRVHGPVRRALV